MKPPFLLLVSLCCIAITRAHAQFPPFPTADRVLGQSAFTTSDTALTRSGMNLPSGVAVDPLSGKVFVSIAGHNRILRFANGAALTNGANAEAVIGQVSYATSAFGATAASLNSPYGIEIDRLGRLWVADNLNNRVLMYEDAANLPEFSATADLVLGQPDFVTITSGTSQTKMSGPTGVHVDAADNLWVAEYNNDRVLKFANVSTLADGAPATTVLGQPDFNTGTGSTSGVKMQGAVAVVTDANGGLWVADQENNRILRFNGAAGLSNGAPANFVLGQTDFNTSASGAAPDKLQSPSSLAIDRNGTLYISDHANSRVVYHKTPGAKADGAAADGVIGQPDLATFTPGTSAQNLNLPYGGLDFDAAGNLWISDYNNNRAIRFPGDFNATAPAVTSKVPKIITRAFLSVKGTASDPGGVSRVKFRVGNSTYRDATGTTTWSFRARLKRGRNTIGFFMVDTFGNTSPVKRLRVKRR